MLGRKPDGRSRQARKVTLLGMALGCGEASRFFAPVAVAAASLVGWGAALLHRRGICSEDGVQLIERQEPPPY